ncbi:MAG TPA: GPP34 family phosphoprotein, partial [Candidatus Cloacimonas sp.]|nr:GPP34 family phosphoprotein [Candidatus Cloacimonas acidaminovorans]HRU83601.1 GPP34 family phosphoprotein [Candidatus Cloacimonas sp.]
MILNCAEELILLSIDDQTNSFYRITNINFNVALIGALLMDLALRKRIDVDLEGIYVLSTEPTGDKFLDAILENLIETEAGNQPAVLVGQLYNSMGHLKDKLLQDLEEKGIIKVSQCKVLWLFKKRRYPIIDQKEEEEVLSRIRKTVLTDVDPEPRDLALIALLNICNLMDKIFTNDELEQRSERLEQLKKLDLISPAVKRIIGEMQV